jgi:hypothetical protein
MDVYTYERICKDVKSGIKHMVLNTETNMSGVVDLGQHGFFNVKVGDGEEVWPLEKCAEVDVEETKRTGRLVLS